ncbi:hypothetical protein PLESTM_001743200 [Pleodorina starrii]|nr:hypothetical protein PLESTM_001743200 [Pleodorina starrii]
MASTLQAGVACWPAPTQSVTPGRALFAKGLAKGCTSAHLQSIFSAFGTVTDCQIARHRSGRSAGFAIVTFLRHEEAVAAMQAMDNFLYMGRRLSVKWFSPERALEGSSHSVDVLNMQTLQHALQLSALQPADLMAQLAQMLESPRIVTQQPQNPHVAAWLDNFMLAQQRDSPLTPQLHDPTQQPTQLDLLNLSALSLTDLPAHGLAMPTGASISTHPATPSSLDVPDGAVFVTTTAANASAGSKAAGGSSSLGGVHYHLSNGSSSSGGGGGGHHAHHPPVITATNTATSAGSGGNLVLAHSRLSKWCTAPGPGSAGGRSSAAQSLADDASSETETVSVHASDDSSIATTSAPMLVHTSCDAPGCSTEGSSPAGHLVLSEAGAAAAAVTTVPAPPPGTPSSATCAAAGNAVCLPTDGDDALLRSRAYAAAAAAAMANSRPGVVGSDPGNLQQALGRQAGVIGATAPPLPGVPPLPPLRTVATAPPAGVPTHHHHHHHGNHHQQQQYHGNQHYQQMSRGAMPPHQGRASAPMFNSCGGGAAATAPDSCLQQALRLQQALADQARTMNAQQQYVDALAKLAAAREQVMAAASLLNNSGSGMATAAAGLSVPQTLAHHHQPHMAAPPPSPATAAAAAAAAGPMGAYMTHMTAGPGAAAAAAAVNPYLSAPPAPGAVPDLSTLLMFQNAASMSRPLY